MRESYRRKSAMLLWNQYNDLTNAEFAVGFSACLAAMASGESLNLHGLYGGS